jgi:hypothetical protein
MAPLNCRARSSTRANGLAAKAAAENVPGVKSVTDRLTWVDPLYGVALSPPEALTDRE